MEQTTSPPQDNAREALTSQDIHLVGKRSQNAVTLANMDRCSIERAIEVWDQVGSLASEVASSMISKQASVLCDRFAEQQQHHQTQMERPRKKRRKDVSGTEAPRDGQEDKHETAANNESTVVTSDDESQDNEKEGIPGNFIEQVNRMGRMSKLIMEIEYCHRMLRTEMASMRDDNDLLGL